MNNHGIKYTCTAHGCGTKFYNLNKPNAVCPACGTDPTHTPAPTTPRPQKPHTPKPSPNDVHYYECKSCERKVSATIVLRAAGLLTSTTKYGHPTQELVAELRPRISCRDCGSKSPYIITKPSTLYYRDQDTAAERRKSWNKYQRYLKHGDEPDFNHAPTRDLAQWDRADATINQMPTPWQAPSFEKPQAVFIHNQANVHAMCPSCGGEHQRVDPKYHATGWDCASACDLSDWHECPCCKAIRDPEELNDTCEFCGLMHTLNNPTGTVTQHDPVPPAEERLGTPQYLARLTLLINADDEHPTYQAPLTTGITA